ncbi:MAG: hypothetical protein CMO80_05490 [Verrucomicrobiales bacterium]|nr:hypothetical protein [Verrucomicrobiales bacterium]
MLPVRIALIFLVALANRNDLFAADHPDATALFAKVVRRAQQNSTNSPVYLFDKRTTIDTFDSKGKITKRKVKLFLVTVTGGVPSEKLVALEGKKLSEKELAKEEEKSKRWSRKFTRQNDNSSKRSFVPSDLAQRFELSYERAEKRDDRKIHVLSFQTRTDAPKPKTFSDRILKELSGRLWIDDTDSEISRVEVKLGKKVTLWGGVLGVLNKFEMSLLRRRSANGVWFNKAATINLDARGLFKRLRMNIDEQSSNFRKASDPALKK